MRIDKTVFISYRRTNFYHALAIYQDLTQNGYDVFFDYTSIPSGDFEEEIIENIKARSHFIAILTPSALEHCSLPDDWLRKEIEAAIDFKRNIIPLFFEGFDFSAPSIANHLTGKLEVLKRYNGLEMSKQYIFQALEILRSNRFLSRSLTDVKHPKYEMTSVARELAQEQKGQADTQTLVRDDDLSAEEYFEIAFYLQNEDKDFDAAIKNYTQAIRLNPNLAAAYNNLAGIMVDLNLYEKSLEYYDKAISLNPDYAHAYANRANLKNSLELYQEALIDSNKAVELQPNFALAYNNRGIAKKGLGLLREALADYNKAIKLDRNYAAPYVNRGNVRLEQGELFKAVRDYDRAIRMNPENAAFYFMRGQVRMEMKHYPAALADFEKILEIGDVDNNQLESEVIRKIQRIHQLIAN